MASESIFEKMVGGSVPNTDDKDHRIGYRYYKCNLVNTKWTCIHQNTVSIQNTVSADIVSNTDIIKCPAWIPKALDIYMLKALVKQKNMGK